VEVEVARVTRKAAGRSEVARRGWLGGVAWLERDDVARRKRNSEAAPTGGVRQSVREEEGGGRWCWAGEVGPSGCTSWVAEGVEGGQVDFVKGEEKVGWALRARGEQAEGVRGVGIRLG